MALFLTVCFGVTYFFFFFLFSFLFFSFFVFVSLELDDEDLPWRTDISPVLECFSLGHGLLAFVNGAYLGKRFSIFSFSFILGLA